MKARELTNLGVPKGQAMQRAKDGVLAARRAKLDRNAIRRLAAAVVADPEKHRQDPYFGELARVLLEKQDAQAHYTPRADHAPYRQWGEDLDAESIRQMNRACSLPISVAGALMPDAHVGYGLPIGGVLATRNAVIPYAVGVDIACRMKLSVTDLPLHMLAGQVDRLKKAIEKETRFGIGATFKDRRDHPVMDENWSVTQATALLQDKAWAQLGTSGSGNHFVEFGILEVFSDALGIPRGNYLALLSHSGSRGTGAEVAGRYSRLARDLHPELPKELAHLAWLDLDDESGREYWQAMQLMGKYAAANHDCIHRHVTRALGARVVLDVENHHNFAWIEEHFGKRVVVHRKGATPAGEGVLGVIPGSMATAAYVVRGKGNPDSLRSAAHGAGRVMSRTQARQTFTWSEARKVLAERGVTLLSAGLDEVPMVYKDIEQVMAAQADLVEPLARFMPKLVKMAPAGERPED